MAVLAGMQKKQWVIKPADANAHQLAVSLDVADVIAQLLINREITDTTQAKAFLEPKLTDLIRPEQMPGIEQAVPRIKKAVENGEKITIYGDYDVDGITAVAMLLQVLKFTGAKVDFYIPHRIDEGYGLNREAIETLAKGKTNLLITVDCGITAIESAKLANDLGMDLIITDHHRPEQQLPKAAAIVHPGLDENYPNQQSAGAMVAFKLAWAIANEFNKGPRLEPQLREFMISATGLASLGTITDVMDLRGENRVLVSCGLKTLTECNLVGIDALLEMTGLLGKGLGSFHIGFRIGPLLNAAGRMGHARLAVELLTSENRIRAIQISEYLKEQNSLRQQYQRKIYKQACEMINEQGLNHPDRKTIVLASQGWHKGVIGIVASRIIDRYYRPTIMLNIDGQTTQGSARSIKGFDILKAIRACSQELTNFGGHEMAAGLTMESSNLEQFISQFEQYAGENLNTDDIIDKLYIDAHVQLSSLNLKTINQLKMLEPFGQANPTPVFATKGVRLVGAPRRVGSKGDHLQITITDNSATIRCIGLNRFLY